MTSILRKLRTLAAELDQAQRALLDIRATRASDDQVR
jgi:hypothetical protein